MKIFHLLLLLLCLGIAKLLLLGMWMLSGKEMTLPRAWAEEKSSTEACPPELFEALKLERAKLERKKKEIELKENRLKILEKQVERRLAVLLELESSLEEKLKKIQVIETERFRLLVKAYSEMRPSKAAKLLINMDTEMAVRILSSLKSNQVARILAAMPPEKAAPLAEALSGYPPKEF